MMKHFYRTIISFFILLLSFTPCHGKTYKWVDEKGTIHFSDQPPQKGRYKVEEVEDKKKQNQLKNETSASESDITGVDYNQRIKKLSNVVIFEDENPHETGKNKILKVTLIQEKNDKLLFDVDYLYDKKLEGDVHLMVTPNMSYWSVNQNKISPGKNRTSISVGLQEKAPEVAFSDQLRMSLSWYSKEKYEGEIFTRVVPFEKKWRKSGTGSH